MIQKRLCRKWLLTIAAPKQSGYDHDSIKRILKRWKGVCYWCMCDEIDTTNLIYHTHLYIVGENAIPRNEVYKRFPKAFINESHGSDEEVIAYIKKEGRYKTDKEINHKMTFEESIQKTGIISEVIWKVKRCFRRKRR